MNTTTTQKTITIYWSAFSKDSDYGRKRGEETNVTIAVSYPVGTTDLEICEQLFHDFNTYTGVFKTFEETLPQNRTHTALSVGDKVRIDYNTYECEFVGWNKI